MALFGTDGIRGLANGSILTAETALSAAVAAAHILVESSANTRPRFNGEIASDFRPIYAQQRQKHLMRVLR